MPAIAAAQSRTAQSSQFPGLSAIREQDLRRDIEIMASDAMRGREAGTLDELRAAAWVAEQARKAGLAPAGDDGTYFQYVPMRRTVMAANSSVTIGGRTLALGRDYALLTPTNAHINAPMVYADASAPGTSLPDLSGKVVVVPLKLAALEHPNWDVPQDVRGAINRQQAALRAAGLASAAALVVLGEPGNPPDVLERAIAYFMLGTYRLDTGTVVAPRMMPVILIPNALTPDAIRAPSAQFVGDLITTTYKYPSVNVTARVMGTDPARRDEYVAFSAHLDHDGVRPGVGADSIWNGADDNASSSVGILAAGRAFAAHPAPRSALFIWHGAEEKGLIGSRWHALHPVVPLTSIVALINGDMIGRNNPDSITMLGTQPPHRASTQLAEMALRANAAVGHFQLDTISDRPDHPGRSFFLSDHISYVEVGVPVVHLESGVEPEMHTPFDTAVLINFAKLRRVSQLMYATGWLVATAPLRPAVDAKLTVKSLFR